MAETVEQLRAELDALRAEFTEFKNYAKPVIDEHQPTPTPEWRVTLPLLNMLPPRTPSA